MPEKDKSPLLGDSPGQPVRAGILILAGMALSQASEIAKDIAIAGKYGSGMLADAYFAAFTPLYVIFTIVLLSCVQVLVPVFSSLARKNGAEETLGLFSNLFWIFVLFFLLLSGLVSFLADQIVGLLTPGLDSATSALAAINLKHMTWILGPAAGVAVTMALLRSARHYFAPSILRLAGNFGFLAAILLLARESYTLIVAVWAFFCTQALFTGIFFGRSGLAFLRPSTQFLKTTRKTLLLFLYPGGFMLAAQLTIIVERYFASLLEPGSLSLVAYTGRIYTGLVNLAGGAVIGALLPMLSILAGQGRMAEVGEWTNKSLRLLILASLPGFVVLMVFSGPLAQLLWGWSKALSQREIEICQTLLQFYGMGFVFAILMPVGSSVLSAIMDFKAVLIAGLFFLLLNVAANSLLFLPLGLYAMPLARTFANLGALVLMLGMVRRKTGPLWGVMPARFFLKSLAAAFAMALVLAGAKLILLEQLAHAGRFMELLFIILSVATACGVFAAACALLQIEEGSFFYNLIKRKLKKDTSL